ncbi:catalase family protein [Kutzneria sp. NPDC052558]|uniref:catalase family protein n=1 Tax=Kutzneria sp. NPDC052558 TaxID=3364121 RepID=UPI0037C9BC3B
MDFVPYTAYESHLPATFDEDERAMLDEVGRTVERHARDHDGHATRDVHAKGYGAARATVEVLPGLAPEYAQGVYAVPATYEAVVRLSNGLPHLRPDRYLGAGCGFAIKMFGVPGRSVLGDQDDAGTMDLAMINNPTFFCNTARDYLTVQKLFDQVPDALAKPDTRRVWFTRFLTRDGQLDEADWLWDELLALLSLFALPKRNLLSYTYWSMGAFRHGDYIAKLRIAPTPDSLGGIEHMAVDAAAELEPYRRTLVAEAGERDHAFDLQVQLCTDLELMPVENTSVAWPEQVSPFVTVARITVPRQEIGGDRNVADGDRLYLTPWRTRAEHAPLGQINRLRESAYRVSAQRRREINGDQVREPAGAGEVLS